MSCDVAASLTLWLAAVTRDPQGAADRLLRPATAVATVALDREPLYAGIVAEAAALKKRVERYRASGAAPADLPAFKAKIDALAAQDMKGHFDLARRGTDGDLKCILKGIAQDLPKRFDQLAASATPAARDQALKEMAYLLNDNVEVITAPPKPPV